MWTILNGCEMRFVWQSAQEAIRVSVAGLLDKTEKH